MKTNSGVKEVEDMRHAMPGEIALYALPNGEYRPAMIVRVPELDVADLQIFLAGEYDLQFVANGVRMFDPSETNIALAFRQRVKRGDAPGTWDYKQK